MARSVYNQSLQETREDRARSRGIVAVPSLDPYILTPLYPKNILRELLDSHASQVSTSIVSVVGVLEDLLDRFKAIILANALDERVAGFKSVICYRYGRYDTHVQR